MAFNYPIPKPCSLTFLLYWNTYARMHLISVRMCIFVSYSYLESVGLQIKLLENNINIMSIWSASHPPCNQSNLNSSKLPVLYIHWLRWKQHYIYASICTISTMQSVQSMQIVVTHAILFVMSLHALIIITCFERYTYGGCPSCTCACPTTRRKQ